MSTQFKPVLAVVSLVVAACVVGCSSEPPPDNSGPKVGAATPGGGQISVGDKVGRKPRMGPRPPETAPATTSN